MRFILLFCAIVGTALGGVFNFTDFDDPLEPVIPEARGQTFFLTDNSVCSVSNPGTGVIQYGQCTTSGTCKSPSTSAGQGSCGTLSQCCIYQAGCGTTTNKKVTYFTYDGTTQSQIPSECQYTITPYNNNICQLRVDFVKFQLTNPRQPPLTTTEPYTCLDDYLSIKSSNPKIPARICGYNTGQHLYIPMNVSNSENYVIFIMSLASRTPAAGSTAITALTTPSWSLRISQLECPGSGSSKGVNADKDFLALAPPGCLQYYTDRTGTVMNLGYNPGQNLQNNFYLPNMDYSLCFRREPGQCSIKFTVVAFLMGGAVSGAGFCQRVGGEYQDYIFLAESTQTLITGTATSTTMVNIYCKTQLQITTTTVAAYIETTAQMPFALHFKSDDKGVAAATNTENGWLLNYEINACPP